MSDNRYANGRRIKKSDIVTGKEKRSTLPNGEAEKMSEFYIKLLNTDLNCISWMERKLYLSFGLASELPAPSSNPRMI